MSRLFLSIICFFVLFFAPLQLAKSENSPYASLLTCSPGEEVYSFFGHTALRYCNPHKGIDVVFNYGVFDFDTPNFVGKFVLGETDYMLGAVDYPYFIQEYAMRGSRVDEQVLNLDSMQTERLFALLRKNYQPANRVYRYNYFYNNCTTKARDIIEQAVAADGVVKYLSQYGGRSFRDVVHGFTAVSPWYSFGIDLLLGADADVAQDSRALQFIPSFLMHDFSSARISLPDGEKPMVLSENELVGEQENDDAASPFTPNLFFALLLVLVALVTYTGYRKRKIFWGVDVLLMLVQGLAGAMILFMVLFSSHPAVGRNMLLFCLNPLPLLLLPILLYAIICKKTFSVMWLQAAMMIVFMVVAPLLPQYFPLPVYLFAATLLLRSLFLIYYKRICV